MDTSSRSITSYTLDISDTPLNITEDTEIRRLTFATRSTVSCPAAAGLHLAHLLLVINVAEPQSQRLRPMQVKPLIVIYVTSLVYTVNTTNTQPTDTYQWAINRCGCYNSWRWLCSN